LYVGSISHFYEISSVMPSRILPTSGIRTEGSCRRCRHDSDRLIWDEECRRGTLTWVGDCWVSKCESKPTTLRFWVDGVIPLYVGSISHSYEIFPVMPPRILPTIPYIFLYTLIRSFIETYMKTTSCIFCCKRSRVYQCLKCLIFTAIMEGVCLCAYRNCLIGKKIWF